MNDTYKMDLILVHAPHLIALACIYIASVLREKDTTAWFEELRVDMNVVNFLLMRFSVASYSGNLFVNAFTRNISFFSIQCDSHLGMSYVVESIGLI